MTIGLSVIQNLYLIVFYNGEIMNVKNDLIIKYLDQFPNIGILTLAKKIFNENKLKYKDVENVRSQIRYLKGSKGSSHLKRLSTDKYLLLENRERKYNLPPSIEHEYKPYQIVGNNGLIFADVHIPFHNLQAFYAMFDYTINKDIDFIIILGDFMDCFDISNFDKEPDLIRFNDERNQTKEFLKELKKIYSKAKIYYKFGNHEKRFESYLIRKAPEIYGCEEFRLEVLLDLFNLGVTYIPEEKYITLQELNAFHGHEYKNGITSPANPARTAFLRSKAISLVAHNHQTSEHTESRIDGYMITCWSIGCMCGLHPKYLPLNKWNNGFALYKTEDKDFWTIQNKRIIKNKVV
jgi:predicted phosphodiesterase